MSSPSAGQRFIRQVNDSIYDVLYKLQSEDGEFWCECDDMHCDTRVVLTLREYAALRMRGGILVSRVHAHAVAVSYDG
jgi:hypothetical protein